MKKLPQSTEAWLAIWTGPVIAIVTAIKATLFPDLSVSEESITNMVSMALAWILARQSKKFVARRNGE